MVCIVQVDLTSADPGNPRSLPHIRLRSMFAETPDDSLLFQVSCVSLFNILFVK